MNPFPPEDERSKIGSGRHRVNPNWGPTTPATNDIVIAPPPPAIVVDRVALAERIRYARSVATRLTERAASQGSALNGTAIKNNMMGGALNTARDALTNLLAIGAPDHAFASTLAKLEEFESLKGFSSFA